jgi:hypothetical protein
MAQRKMTKGQPMITNHYTENKRLRNMNPTKTGVFLGAPEGLVVHAPLVTTVVSLLNNTNII